MIRKRLKKSDFPRLITALQENGYEVIGPQVDSGAIVYKPLSDVSQLPEGYSDDQKAGHYRLKKNKSNRWFAWANAAQSIKPFAFVPTEVLWSSSKISTPEASGETIQFQKKEPDVVPQAILGVRSCDLAALAIQDAHFLQQSYIDSYYQARREKLLLIAVNCTHPSKSCFCHSTGDGPSATTGFDILLDELDSAFVIQAGSGKGDSIVSLLPLEELEQDDLLQVDRQNKVAEETQTKKLPNADVRLLLKENSDSEFWDDIAKRCLACGNCTSVCPSCFCYSEHEQPELDGNKSTHIREWDSCFNQSHSYIHGIVVRSETKHRYRQWLTHKFSGWFDQFGKSGCVGCGRCTTWCPVGIDVVDAVKNICEMENA